MSNDGAAPGASWAPVEHLLEVLAGDTALVEEAVRDVRVAVPGIARISTEDVARHTRALFAAAVKAIAARRGPTRAELDFIEDLAVTRAGQDVAVQDVLAAIHLAQRHIWWRARALAPDHGVGVDLLLDAKELFDDWAEQVRGRLIVAHRRTELSRARRRHDRQGRLLRRLLGGGSAAALAAAESGLPGDALWVVHGDGSRGDIARWQGRLRTGDADLFGLVDDAFVGVLAAAPAGWDDVPLGVAGPAVAEDLDAAARDASRAHDAAALLGRVGLVRVSDVAAAIALRAASDVGSRLRTERLAALDPADEYAVEIAETVRAHLERDRSVAATAASLYVHPNTVRHRLHRFERLTGLRLGGTFTGIEAWWAVTGWLAQRSPGRSGGDLVAVPRADVGA